MSSESVLSSVDVANNKINIIKNESSKVKVIGEENVINLKKLGDKLKLEGNL